MKLCAQPEPVRHMCRNRLPPQHPACSSHPLGRTCRYSCLASQQPSSPIRSSSTITSSHRSAFPDLKHFCALTPTKADPRRFPSSLIGPSRNLVPQRLPAPAGCWRARHCCHNKCAAGRWRNTAHCCCRPPAHPAGRPTLSQQALTFHQIGCINLRDGRQRSTTCRQGEPPVL